MSSCVIQSVHFTKNGSVSFDCRALPEDNLEIEITITGTGDMVGIVEYDSPYMIGDSIPFSFGVLSGGSKTMSVPLYSPGGAAYNTGTYKIKDAYVFARSDMGTPLCRKTISAIPGGACTTITIPVPADRAQIAISPVTSSITVGATKLLSVVCKGSSGAVETCPALTWTSSNPAIATVNAAGLVTGVTAGSAYISASAGGIDSNQHTVTVSLTDAPVLTSISITPTSKTIGIDKTVQLSAVCKDQNNDVMTCPTLTWDSSDDLIATVSLTGLVAGKKEGTAIITSSAEGKTGISIITVSTTPPPEDEEGEGISTMLILGIATGLGLLLYATRNK